MDLSALKDFRKFVDKEVIPGVKDLKNLDEKNRVHVQKLVFTNLVDRFDTLIDSTLLDNCRHETLLDLALKDLGGPVTESELMKLLMQGDKLQGALDAKIKNGLRNSIIRERHSKKLSTLFLVLQPHTNSWNVPRVNISTGAILDQIKPQGTQIPYTICGYADWLYSRRNSVVHGGGTNKYLANDTTQLKKLFKVDVPQTFKIKLSSVENTIIFYKDLIDILEGQ